MNGDAERIIKESEELEDIQILLELMKKLSEQLEYLIEILE